jgi:hypothetical protein
MSRAIAGQNKRALGERHGAFQKVLAGLGWCMPGDRLKTAVYLNCIAGPRKTLRQAVTGFYRMDHVYDVLRQFKRDYAGRFSILEFGVADGYSFTKKLFATEYLGMADRVVVHGFDTFTGLPEVEGTTDQALVRGQEWVPGTYVGRHEQLQDYCERRYHNFELHKGLFKDTLTDVFLQRLEESPPILIWIDCDYYSSTRQVLERLIPYIPTGCVMYFDDIYFNFSSRFTGEMRAVAEVNNGDFGDGIELVPDRDLSWDSNRVYRFINLHARTQHCINRRSVGDPVRYRRDDSPFP